MGRRWTRISLALLAAAAVATAAAATDATIFTGVAATRLSGSQSASEITSAAAPGSRSRDDAIYEGTVSFGCTSFSATGSGPAILDRDNTGSDQEVFRIDVVDGNDTSLYSQTFIGPLGTYSGGLIGTTEYTFAPRANPLTLTLTSLAGNGLPAQSGFSQRGTCSGLPLTSASIPTLARFSLVALAALLALCAPFASRHLGRRFSS